MTTNSIPWKEKAAWTITLTIARNLSRPRCLGSKPRGATAPGCFQYFNLFKLPNTLWNKENQPGNQYGHDLVHLQGQWQDQREGGQWWVRSWSVRRRTRLQKKFVNTSVSYPEALTFSEIPDTKDIDRTNEDTENGDEDWHVFCRKILWVVPEAQKDDGSGNLDGHRNAV